MAGESLSDRLERLSPAQRALLDQRRREPPADGHRLVGRTLAALGVTHVYGVPGQPVYDTFAACAEARLHVIDTHHQQSAALMAMAHNYMAGAQRAACLLSRGAPVANALTAALIARDNCWPLLLLAGAPPSAAQDSGYFMNLDGAELFRAATKSAMRVPHTQAIPDALSLAFETAMSGRPGPVFVDLPQDALDGLAVGSIAPRSRSVPSATEPDPVALRSAVAALTGAARPLLIVGKGMRWTASFADLRDVVDGLALPLVTSPMGRGIVPDTHPLCMNEISWIAQAQADVVLVVGARLDWTFRYGAQFAAGATIIHVDIHAPEFDRPSLPRIRVHADAGCFLRALVGALGPAQRTEALARRDSTWIPSLRQSAAEAQTVRRTEVGRDEPPIAPLRMAREINAALPDDVITVLDGNVSMAASERMIPVRAPVSRLTPGGSGCLGMGIPFAVAAKLAQPERPVVAICGDFSVGFGVMEFETAVRHDVPIVVVVANNNGNGGSPRQRLRQRHDACAEPIAMFQPGIRYDQIAGALGALAIHVEHANDIAPAVRRAIASNRPACINITVDPDVPFPLG